MLILKPNIFQEFPEIIFGFSIRSVWNYDPPYYFNLSLSVDDDKKNVIKNRETFFNLLELSPEQAAFQKQVHGDKIANVPVPGDNSDSDAMITDRTETALCISTADCTAVFIYDSKQKIIAAVHSGWRGTHKRITEKTVKILKNDYKSNPDNLSVYLGPSIGQVNYEVGNEVAGLFDNKYLIRNEDRFLLDVSLANYDMLTGEGIPPNQIQKSSLCSFEYSELFHSYRRDAMQSGRSLGVIAMRDTV